MSGGVGFGLLEVLQEGEEVREGFAGPGFGREEELSPSVLRGWERDEVLESE